MSSQAITLEAIEAAHKDVAEMIERYKAQANPQVAFPISVEFPHLNQGERYIGTIINAAGKAEHVILLSGDSGDMTWQEAKDWAASIGGDLPNRIEQAMLFDGFKDEFQKDWYWSNTQHASDSDCAWMQYFDDGSQGGSHKSYTRRARAVRRLVL